MATIILFVAILIGCNATSATRQPDTMLSDRLPNEIFGTPTPTIAGVEEPLETRAPELASDALANETVPQSNGERPTINTRQRCGLLLPIVGDKQGIESSRISGEFDDGLVPEPAMPALQRIVSSPQSVALVAFEIGNEAQGIYHNGESLMPLASVVKLVNLVAFAESLEEGLLDPGTWVPVDELDKFYLPGTDLGAHQRAINELQERGLVGRSPPSIPLEEFPWMMIRHSSNAASDYIHQELGQETIEATALKLGLESQTAPCPWIGQFLIINNHQMDSSDSYATVQALIENPADHIRPRGDATSDQIRRRPGLPTGRIESALEGRTEGPALIRR